MYDENKTNLVIEKKTVIANRFLLYGRDEVVTDRRYLLVARPRTEIK